MEEEKHYSKRQNEKRLRKKNPPLFLKCGERQDYLQGNTDFPHGNPFFCEPSDMIW